MSTVPDPRVNLLRDVVASYVRAVPIPALDERAIASRRGRFAAARTSRRPLLQRAALVTAAALALFLTANGSTVVAGMQRVFSAFWLMGNGRTEPMTVREVDLAKARADVPFEIIVPPVLSGTSMTLREIVSSAAPANDSVAFELETRRPGPGVSIVESRDGGANREFYVSEREPDRGDAHVAPLPAIPKRADMPGPQISVVGKLGGRSFVPLTWVTRGTRIVLMSPPGALSDEQVRTIRSAMSK